MWPGGNTTIPSGVPPCGWRGELYGDQDGTDNNGLIIGLVVAIIAIIFCTIMGILTLRRHKVKVRLEQVMRFNMNEEEVTFVMNDGSKIQLNIIISDDNTPYDNRNIVQARHIA